MSRAGERGRAMDLSAPQMDWESPNWIYDSIWIENLASISSLGGQAIKPWSDGGNITHFKLNSLEETFGTF